jgi:light-regulated signal transduction histidine kinase (bacteriophytochrome)
MNENDRRESQLRHDLRAPFVTLAGVVAALQEEPDMELGDRQEFLQILEREIKTCQNLTSDLLLLLKHVRSPFEGVMGESVSAATVVDHLKQKVLPERPDAHDISVRMHTTERVATLPGTLEVWNLITTNMLDQCLSQSRSGSEVEIFFVEGSVDFTFAWAKTYPGDADTLQERIPQRAKRARFNPHLGMGSFLACQIAVLYGLETTVAQEEELTRIRFALGSTP